MRGEGYEVRREREVQGNEERRRGGEAGKITSSTTPVTRFVLHQ